uniref:ABC transporter domain-containing protein n=1 Tax=viral metagenome TaxID=1070528 RepID=A0A6C0JN87_9ZZZZ
MNIILYLIEKFFEEEYLNTFILVFFNFINIILKINGVSYITANIIKGIETKNYKIIHEYFYYLIAISIAFISIYGTTHYLENKLLTKLTQWVKNEILRIIIITNNEDFSDANFIEYITPITRISVSSYVLFTTIFLKIIPHLSFLIIIAGYFFYKNSIIGLFFIISNVLLLIYIYFFWNSWLKEKVNIETNTNENEKYIINLLNNMDKVIYRGETINEINNYKSKTDKNVNMNVDFYKNLNMHSIILNVVIHIIIFVIIGYMIFLLTKNKLDATTIVTFLTILLFFRDKMNSVFYEIPSILEFIGRLVYIINEFKNMLGKKDKFIETELKVYETRLVTFNEIRFENVSYLYPKTNKYIFEKFNITLNTNNKIIGITGLSGNGKSTLAKLLIKMYNPTSGDIYIDGVNITELDPLYIRENITYVNQNSKLFDKIVVDNMLYGCSNLKTCQNHLNEIMKYPRIANLYRDIDIYKNKTGSLGEKISGGQRQIVNIISGLINPSKILILDEPTNALDIELKNELIKIIKEFKKYKDCIIIISHDRDLYPLFNERINL